MDENKFNGYNGLGNTAFVSRPKRRRIQKSLTQRAHAAITRIWESSLWTQKDMQVAIYKGYRAGKRDR